MTDRASAVSMLIVAVIALLLCGVVMIDLPLRRADHVASEPITFRIDPNTADAATLCLLPRIGPGIAQRIIDDRNANGPFDSPDDMTRVTMIGDKTVQAFEPWVRVDSSDR